MSPSASRPVLPRVSHRSTLRLGRTALITPVYANFQLPECTARTSPYVWWALASPSHPYPSPSWGEELGRLFSSTLTKSHDLLPVRKRDVLCCPDFPLARSPPEVRNRPATSRTTAIFSLFEYKGTHFVEILTIYRDKTDETPTVFTLSPSFSQFSGPKWRDSHHSKHTCRIPHIRNSVQSPPYYNVSSMNYKYLSDGVNIPSADRLIIHRLKDY